MSTAWSTLILVFTFTNSEIYQGIFLPLHGIITGGSQRILLVTGSLLQVMAPPPSEQGSSPTKAQSSGSEVQIFAIN